jgi:hypothetical protein
VPPAIGILLRAPSWQWAVPGGMGSGAADSPAKVESAALALQPPATVGKEKGGPVRSRPAPRKSFEKSQGQFGHARRHVVEANDIAGLDCQTTARGDFDPQGLSAAVANRFLRLRGETRQCSSSNPKLLPPSLP